MTAILADKCVAETLPKDLEATAEQPELFDGTTRLYTCYICPFAQRVWITRNYKGLQDHIKLIPINLQAKPAWYAENVYSLGKVPALEHNAKVMGESLDLIKYVDANFDGPALWPEDQEKKAYADEMFVLADKFAGPIYGSLGKPNAGALAGPSFDSLEEALGKYEDGPFFLGQFSLVDIAFVTLVMRFQIWLMEGAQYDILVGRPKLALWLEEMDKIEAYKQTKPDPNGLIAYYRMKFSG